MSFEVYLGADGFDEEDFHFPCIDSFKTKEAAEEYIKEHEPEGLGFFKYKIRKV